MWLISKKDRQPPDFFVSPHHILRSKKNFSGHLKTQVPQYQAFSLPGLGKPEFLRVVCEEASLLVVQQVGQQVLQQLLQLLGGRLP